MRLLVIADDFTGAMDTGVQFSQKGVETCVLASHTALDTVSDPGRCQVAVVNSCSRHLSADEAYRRIYGIVKQAIPMGFDHIYKKTDSALRGNIGSELKAVLDASGASYLPFLPAFPEMNRTVENGVLLIDGTPVTESVFGADPFEPVRFSAVADIVHAQVSGEVNHASPRAPFKKAGIVVFDTRTAEDFADAVRDLGEDGLKACSGCAGFARVLADALGFTKKTVTEAAFDTKLLVVSGSVNPISIRQLGEIEKELDCRVGLSPERKLGHAWLDTAEGNEFLGRVSGILEREGVCIVDSLDAERNATIDYAKTVNCTLSDVRKRTAECMGLITRALLDSGVHATVMCIGGDTLQEIMRLLNIACIEPLIEFEPGVVMSSFPYGGKTYHLITKSGGFGEKDLIVKIRNAIRRA